MTTKTKTAFCWPVRIYYEDTDHGGVVYNANYLKFMERSRTELLRAQGLEQDSLINEHDLIFAVRSTHIDFLSPAKFNDQLLVTTEIESSNRLKVDFRQNIYRIVDQSFSAGFIDRQNLQNFEKLTAASVSVVALSAASMKPRRMPEQLFKELMREH
ncbi:MAG: YbgC/FadM family acyl-CoA thioesterase [Gammaproteobacteria bacterium]|nr:YbgC/FadM family acyl-CoA thioesterase [Gammaproteobacteria bacterium]